LRLLREVLPTIRVPTLVLYRPELRDQMLDLARRVKGARALEFRGSGFGIFEPITREIDAFLSATESELGDGFFAIFDGPARAISCARAIVGAVAELDLAVRAGVHTGECELHDGKVTGLAVNIGARVAAAAGVGEVLVTRTVKDLVAGSGFSFEARGEYELKGVPESWWLYEVAV
jgi:class 3 adenylate cyclase